jgi:hypothetical protein
MDSRDETVEKFIRRLREQADGFYQGQVKVNSTSVS